jgi:hypothetical protein
MGGIAKAGGLVNESSTHDRELREAVASALDGALLESPTAEVEELLGRALQEQVLSGLGSDTGVPEWAAGTFGPASLAQRFIAFHRRAISGQLCDPDGSGLKQEYVRLLAPGAAKAGALSTISAAVMTILPMSSFGAAGVTVAVYVALWLLHADLQRWCSEYCGGGGIS